MPKAKGAPAPATEIEPLLFSLDDCNQSVDLAGQIPAALPEWIGDLILSSAEALGWGKNATAEPTFDDEIPF